MADIGLIGLAVMGQNLVLNMNDHGYVVCVFNRTISKIDSFLSKEAANTNVIGAHTIEEFIDKLKSPKIIMLMIQAGKAVDDFIDLLLPHLKKSDIIIDGGNSEYIDSTRRMIYLKNLGIYFVGTGVSGGEEGARYGPSLMPGGNELAWPTIKPIFQDIAAKVDNEACCDWVGGEGAGHFVKMVHNGIEYGDMQLICEAYHILKDYLNMSCDEIADIFNEWNNSELNSYLIEITRDILHFKHKDGTPLVEKILDSAGQKGTGKWTGISALQFGIPVTLIVEAVFSRCLSSLKEERLHASKVLNDATTMKKKSVLSNLEKKNFIEDIRLALYASKIVSYSQGYMLMKEASDKFQWNLNYGNVSLIWRGGCIIRSKFLSNIKTAYDKKHDLTNIMLDDFFVKELNKCQKGWRNVICVAVSHSIPAPTFSAALSFFDGYKSSKLPANLIQAQRDYFGAHMYQLLDTPGEYEHCNWTGYGGNVSSTTYQV